MSAKDGGGASSTLNALYMPPKHQRGAVAVLQRVLAAEHGTGAVGDQALPCERDLLNDTTAVGSTSRDHVPLDA